MGDGITPVRIKPKVVKEARRNLSSEMELTTIARWLGGDRGPAGLVECFGQHQVSPCATVKVGIVGRTNVERPVQIGPEQGRGGERFGEMLGQVQPRGWECRQRVERSRPRLLPEFETLLITINEKVNTIVIFPGLIRSLYTWPKMDVSLFPVMAVRD